jgi:accessory gene regulator protein AgrB
LVVSFAQEELAVERYSVMADEATRKAKKSAMTSGLVIFFLVIFLFSYATYSFFLGSYLMQIGEINPATGKTYTVFDIIVVS